jgi:ElaA protein
MLNFECKHFNQLTLHELYRVLQLRAEVFIVEQNCPYLDLDNKDQEAYHVLGTDLHGTIQAYTRILRKGVSYDNYASIGRVINSANVRGTGVGKKLMEYSINEILRLYPSDKIKISAQSYLLKFYTELGFKSTGEEYLEDNIPHTAMIYYGEI